jgi:hypothetical protein
VPTIKAGTPDEAPRTDRIDRGSSPANQIEKIIAMGREQAKTPESNF